MEQCCRGFNIGCRACAACDCANAKDRPFPLLLCVGGTISLGPLFPALLIGFTTWRNNCETNWAHFLVAYCALFVVNFLFVWYMQTRFLIKERSDKYDGPCDRAGHIVRHDPGMLAFVIWSVLFLAFNTVIAVMWGVDNDCAAMENSLMEMTHAMWIMAFVFFGAVIVFGAVTVCCCGKSSTPQTKVSQVNPRDEERDGEPDAFDRVKGKATAESDVTPGEANPFDSHPKQQDPEAPPPRPPKSAGLHNGSDSDDFLAKLDRQQ